MSDKLFYIGSFSEGLQSEESNKFLKEAELFTVGTHRGVNYTEEDLNELVKNFDPAEDVPLQYDHSSSARDTVGFLRSVEVKDGKLMGIVEVLDDSAQQRIKSSLNRKLSISFMLKKTAEGYKPHKLREVSLVAFPQVKSARLFSENGFVSTYEEDSNKGDDHMDINKMKEDLRKELEQQYADDIKELNELRVKAQEFTAHQIDQKIESFASEKKVIPAQRESLKTLLSTFSEDQMEAFETFMQSQQALDLDENGEVIQEHGDNENNQKTQDELYYEEQAKRFNYKL